jgi:hypothetical protein
VGTADDKITATYQPANLDMPDPAFGHIDIGSLLSIWCLFVSSRIGRFSHYIT